MKRIAKKPVIDQISGKDVIAGIFSVVMGVSDFVEEIEKGREPMIALRKASTKSRRRRAALRRAELEEVEVIEEETDEDPVVEVVRPRRKGA